MGAAMLRCARGCIRHGATCPSLTALLWAGWFLAVGRSLVAGVSCLGWSSAPCAWVTGPVLWAGTRQRSPCTPLTYKDRNLNLGPTGRAHFKVPRSSGREGFLPCSVL